MDENNPPIIYFGSVPQSNERFALLGSDTKTDSKGVLDIFLSEDLKGMPFTDLMNNFEGQAAYHDEVVSSDSVAMPKDYPPEFTAWYAVSFKVDQENCILEAEQIWENTEE